MLFSPSSRVRLTDYDLGRFPDDTLFHRLGRAVCGAACLPRKELFEAWETARRVRRLFRGGRVIDAGGGHGLLAHAMLLLDDSSPEAIVVDTALPQSCRRLHEALIGAWPRLAGRITFMAARIEDIALAGSDIVVSVHACGHLSDVVLDRAAAARARVAVLPCCHDLAAHDDGDLSGWVDGPLAVDIVRALRVKRRGYRVWTQTISGEITPKNRLLIAEPLTELRST
jgi:methyltransferase family protein